MRQEILTIDMFCGAGGSSWGARAAGARIVAAFDFWPVAGEVYQVNFPGTKFFSGKLEERNLRSLTREIGKIDLILASPECTNHSPAKGNKTRSEQSKDTAFQVVRFAEAFGPRWIVIENVVSMKRWDRYNELLLSIRRLGYSVREQVLNSEDFGVPQSRRRLFLMADRELEPPNIVPPKRSRRSAEQIVDVNGAYQYSPLDAPNRAKATIERANRGFRVLGKDTPFLIVYYGSDHAGGWQSLDRPLRTVTTLDRFALIKPSNTGNVIRMLQVPELRAAMGMPQAMKFTKGTRRDQIKMIGNAVCPPVIRHIVTVLTCQDDERKRCQ